MGADNRDWYRDWWRKKTGYVERARFRMGDHEIKREAHRTAWRRNYRIAFAVVLLLLLLALLR